MLTMTQLRAAHPALSAATVARLMGIHTVSGTDREIPRMVVNAGRSVEDVARALSLRIGAPTERRTETYQDAATVAIDDGDGGVYLAVPA